MQKLSLKTLVTEYVKSKYPNWVHKGELGRLAVIEWGYENENMGRRCRELQNEGTLERRINGKSVEYRYKQKEEVKQATNYRCFYCPKTASRFRDDKPVCPIHLLGQPTTVGLF